MNTLPVAHHPDMEPVSPERAAALCPFLGGLCIEERTAMIELAQMAQELESLDLLDNTAAIEEKLASLNKSKSDTTNAHENKGHVSNLQEDEYKPVTNHKLAVGLNDSEPALAVMSATASQERTVAETNDFVAKQEVEAPAMSGGGSDEEFIRRVTEEDTPLASQKIEVEPLPAVVIALSIQKENLPKLVIKRATPAIKTEPEVPRLEQVINEAMTAETTAYRPTPISENIEPLVIYDFNSEIQAETTETVENIALSEDAEIEPATVIETAQAETKQIAPELEDAPSDEAQEVSSLVESLIEHVGLEKFAEGFPAALPETVQEQIEVAKVTANDVVVEQIENLQLLTEAAADRLSQLVESGEIAGIEAVELQRFISEWYEQLLNIVDPKHNKKIVNKFVEDIIKDANREVEQLIYKYGEQSTGIFKPSKAFTEDMLSLLRTRLGKSVLALSGLLAAA